MSQPPATWQAPDPVGGPAPGIDFASPGARLVAYIVDILVINAVCFTFAVVGFIVGLFLPLLLILAGLAIVAVFFGYFPWYWTHGGQTPGMKLMRIKVVRDVDGGPVSAGGAVMRLIGYWVSAIVFYIGFIWIFFDKRRRGWPDLMGGTIVISSEDL